MRMYEIVAEKLNLKEDQVAQISLLLALGYSHSSIAANLQIRRDTVRQVHTTLNELPEELGPSEVVTESVGNYMLLSNFVKDEMVSLYNEQKQDYEASRQGLTRHPDGRAVRRVAVRDMIGTLSAINGQAKDQMVARIGLFKNKDSLNKKNNELPAGTGEFDPALLTDPIDVEFEVIE